MRTIQHVLEQMPWFFKKKLKGCLISHSFLSLCVQRFLMMCNPRIPPPPSVTNHDGKRLHVFLAPVSMLTLTRVPSSEPQTSGWTQHRFPGFEPHERVSAAPQDDSNYCKHVITQEYLSGLALQWGENDWLAVVPPRILSSAAQEQQRLSLQELCQCTCSS